MFECLFFEVNFEKKLCLFFCFIEEVQIFSLILLRYKIFCLYHLSSNIQTCKSSINILILLFNVDPCYLIHIDRHLSCFLFTNIIDIFFFFSGNSLHGPYFTRKRQWMQRQQETCRVFSSSSKTYSTSIEYWNSFRLENFSY